MMAGKNQASQRPTAFGSMLQAATYGLTIPVIYGTTQSPLLAIWANGLRQGGSIKKFKQLKKGLTAYVENIDFLLGKNPIFGVLQMWNNGGKLPLAMASQTFSSTAASALTITDANFYAVIGVTINQTYSQTFNDYGGAGAQTLTGNSEHPLWNALVAGPDPTDASGARHYPYSYRWRPDMGATLHVDSIADGAFLATGFGSITVHYAQLMAATSFHPPMSKLRLSFESELGSGSEYAGYASEQIQYPWYAGMGSPDIDLGSTGTIPQLQAEVQGKFGVYASGDCDFVDMIEDVLKSGITQAALGSTLNFGPTQHGVGCFDYPGAVQKCISGRFETSAAAMNFDLPNAAGNTLVAFLDTDTTSAIGVTDSAGNTWVRAASGTRVDGRTFGYACFYCVGCAAAASNTVTFSGMGFYGSTAILLELSGVDAFDAVTAVSVGTNPGASITTTNAAGLPGVVLAFSMQTNPAPDASRWKVIVPPFSGGDHGGQDNFVQQLTVTNPGTYSLRWTAPATDANCYMFLLAFKATQPPTYPNPLPNILDAATREQTRLQCRAGGLWGSLSMHAQKSAREWIKDMVTAADCAPVMSGFHLKLVPRSEVSAVGNGAVYTAPTASGPVADLDVDRGDFIADAGQSPIQIERVARADLNNVLQMQHLNRTSDYQQVVTTASDAASMLKYGVRKEDPTVNIAIQDVAVARAVLQIEVRRRNYIEPLAYKFKLAPRWQLLEAMDLVTITDRQQGIIQRPVRLTSVEEDDKLGRACMAEPFVYGIHAPQPAVIDQPRPYSPTTSTTAGSVNAPVIFEPTPRLYNAKNQPELWLVVSSANAAYGGCQPFISTDGGVSYNVAGDPIVGSAVTGVTTADWPAASDPDTVNNLVLNLTASAGALASYQLADEDNFVYPCYLAGGSGTIPYELMTYASATLTGTNAYRLNATGTGNKLRRGVFGAPTQGVGVDHPSGSRFALLSPDGQGILKLTIDPLWIGKTLYFKFLAFNTFGAAVQALSDATAYAYTVAGGSGSVNPVGVPPQSFTVNGV